MNNEIAILERGNTKQEFINIFMAVNQCTKSEAEGMFMVESFNFMKALHENPDLGSSSEVSIRGVFLNVISEGLSFSPSADHVYLEYREITVNKKSENASTERRLIYETSPDGDIFLCQRAGSVAKVTIPVMVYDCDIFHIRTSFDGTQYPEHEVTFPRLETAKVAAGYCYVEEPNGNKNFYYMFMNDVERLKEYSKKNNKAKSTANALYTSGKGDTIDTGFFAAKLRKHAVKGYRKKKLTYRQVEPVELLNKTEQQPKVDEDTIPILPKNVNTEF